MALGRKNCNPSGVHSTPPGKQVKRAPADNLPPLKAWDGTFDIPSLHFLDMLHQYFDVWSINTRPGKTPHNWISIEHLPPSVEDTLDRWREKGRTGPRTIGIRPCLYCCLVLGLARIWNHHSIARLRDARAAFISLDQDASPEETAISRFLKEPIKISIPKAEKESVPVHPDFYSDFIALQLDLPISQTDFAVLCCYATLEYQPHLAEPYREEMERTLQSFFFSVSMKAAAVDSMVQEKQRQSRAQGHPLSHVDFEEDMLDSLVWSVRGPYHDSTRTPGPESRFATQNPAWKQADTEREDVRDVPPELAQARAKADAARARLQRRVN